jgi:hypothetical protein
MHGRKNIKRHTVCMYVCIYHLFNNYLINIFLYCWTYPAVINLQQNDYLYKPPSTPCGVYVAPHFLYSTFNRVFRTLPPLKFRSACVEPKGRFSWKLHKVTWVGCRNGGGCWQSVNSDCIHPCCRRDSNAKSYQKGGRRPHGHRFRLIRQYK